MEETSWSAQLSKCRKRRRLRSIRSIQLRRRLRRRLRQKALGRDGSSATKLGSTILLHRSTVKQHCSKVNEIFMSSFGCSISCSVRSVTKSTLPYSYIISLGPEVMALRSSKLAQQFVAWLMINGQAPGGHVCGFVELRVRTFFPLQTSVRVFKRGRV